MAILRGRTRVTLLSLALCYTVVAQCTNPYLTKIVSVCTNQIKFLHKKIYGNNDIFQNSHFNWVTTFSKTPSFPFFSFSWSALFLAQSQQIILSLYPTGVDFPAEFNTNRPPSFDSTNTRPPTRTSFFQLVLFFIPPWQTQKLTDDPFPAKENVEKINKIKI